MEPTANSCGVVLVDLPAKVQRYPKLGRMREEEKKEAGHYSGLFKTTQIKFPRGTTTSNDQKHTTGDFLRMSPIVGTRAENDE